jgi:hypothetical protein
LLAACASSTARISRIELPTVAGMLHHDPAVAHACAMRVFLPVMNADADDRDEANGRHLTVPATALDCLLLPPLAAQPPVTMTSLCPCHGAPLLFTTAHTASARFCPISRKRLRASDPLPGVELGQYSLMLPPTVLQRMARGSATDEQGRQWEDAEARVVRVPRDMLLRHESVASAHTTDASTSAAAQVSSDWLR